MTSSWYFSPRWDVRFRQLGPQPHLGPHSNTTSLGSTNLGKRKEQTKLQIFQKKHTHTENKDQQFSKRYLRNM